MNSPFIGIIGCLLLGSIVGSAHAAPEDPAPPIVEKVPATLTATLSKQEFEADEVVDLKVTLQNNGDKDLPLGDTGFRYSLFDIVVTSIEGTSPIKVGRTSFGEYQLTGTGGGFGNIRLTLPPKGTQRVVFPLRRMFDLSSGGRFSVQVTRSFGVFLERTSASTPTDPPLNPDSYRKETEVKVAPMLSFSVASPPGIEEELTPLPANRF